MSIRVIKTLVEISDDLLAKTETLKSTVLPSGQIPHTFNQECRISHMSSKGTVFLKMDLSGLNEEHNSVYQEYLNIKAYRRNQGAIAEFVVSTPEELLTVAKHCKHVLRPNSRETRQRVEANTYTLRNAIEDFAKLQVFRDQKNAEKQNQ